MDTWELIWKIVFFAGVGLFAVMAVLVSIGGFFDIKKLFRTLKEQHEKNE